MKFKSFLFALALAFMAGPAAWAQRRGNDKDKQEKEYEDRYKYRENHKYEERKDKQEKKYKGGNKEWEQRETQRTRGKVGEILGRVILPPVGRPGPRQLAGVPRGHYPPPGECRIWYPNRPPGHQPPPTSCHNLVGIRLEPGAFILHGDRAYDAAYDWRAEERRHPGSVARDILDILFPRR